MFQCDVCGATESQETLINEVFFIEGDFVLVEKIPATICQRCGESTFSRQTTEQIRRLVHGPLRPKKTIQLQVFEFVS